MTEMAKGDWWLKLDINDWLTDPKLRKLSRENRDSWLTACLMMRIEGEYSLSGTSRDLATLLHLTDLEFKNFIADLKRTNVADVTRSNKMVTLVSRRYEREAKSMEHTRLRVRRHREKADVTPKKRYKSNKSEVKSKEKEVSKEGGEEKPLSHFREEKPIPTEHFIFLGTVEAGLTKRMGIKTLPNQREWHQKFEWAFLNDFTPDAVLETYDLMKKGFWKSKSVSPKSLAENVANLDNLRSEVGVLNGNGNGSKPQWQVEQDACTACDENGYINGVLPHKVCKHK